MCLGLHKLCMKGVSGGKGVQFRKKCTLVIIIAAWGDPNPIVGVCGQSENSLAHRGQGVKVLQCLSS